MVSVLSSFLLPKPTPTQRDLTAKWTHSFNKVSNKGQSGHSSPLTVGSFVFVVNRLPLPARWFALQVVNELWEKQWTAHQRKVREHLEAPKFLVAAKVSAIFFWAGQLLIFSCAFRKYFTNTSTNDYKQRIV